MMNIRLQHWNLLFAGIMGIWHVLNEKNRDIWGRILPPKNFPKWKRTILKFKNQKLEILEIKVNFSQK